MLPFTKADTWPNIGLIVTAGSSSTSLLNAALAAKQSGPTSSNGWEARGQPQNASS